MTTARRVQVLNWIILALTCGGLLAFWTLYLLVTK